MLSCNIFLGNALSQTPEEDGVKMECTNMQCPFKGQLMHRECFEALEENLIKIMSNIGLYPFLFLSFLFTMREVCRIMRGKVKEDEEWSFSHRVHSLHYRAMFGCQL